MSRAPPIDDPQAWRIHTDSCIDAVKEIVGFDPAVFTCPCGCENVVVYAKDALALWVCPSYTTEERGPVRVLGLETRAEFDSYMRKTQLILTARGGPQHTYDELWAVLQPLASGLRPGAVVTQKV